MQNNNQVVVTGVAGFIGSHLAERLVNLGYQVIGIDCFTDYYPRSLKEANLTSLRQESRFHFIEGDILDLDFGTLLGKADFLFHLAAQAGVRTSWGNRFSEYTRNNILATQRLLESARETMALKTMVFASSSSVYGDAETFPTREEVAPRPVSPYGMTKLACEHLCRMYHQSFGVPVVLLRYFTAYGSRQRPDMAFHRFIEAMLQGNQISIYGNGEQTRDFTHISDIVQANILAMNPSLKGQVFNIGGGSQISINEVIKILEELIGTSARVHYENKQIGDAAHTSADISKARIQLGYEPQMRIESGLRDEVSWMKEARRH